MPSYSVVNAVGDLWNIAGSNICLTLFETPTGTEGQDGMPSYSVVNAVGDLWNIVGSWSSPGAGGAGLDLSGVIEWPGGTTRTPQQDRPCTAIFRDSCTPSPTNEPQTTVITNTETVVITPAPVEDDDSGMGTLTVVVVLMAIILIVVVGCMCYLIKKEKSGQAVFDSSVEA